MDLARQYFTQTEAGLRSQVLEKEQRIAQLEKETERLNAILNKTRETYRSKYGYLVNFFLELPISVIKEHVLEHELSVMADKTRQPRDSDCNYRFAFMYMMIETFTYGKKPTGESSFVDVCKRICVPCEYFDCSQVAEYKRLIDAQANSIVYDRLGINYAVMYQEFYG
jgi:hypothetical protein